MKVFIEELEKNCRAFPDRLSLATDAGEEKLSYGELWEQSGRVYAFLKEKGIGREDFVMIRLPRGVRPVVAMVGILRAGAAFVLTETIYPAERIAYIYQDCGCKLEIDEKVYEEMMGCASRSGYEAADPKDACFAVYTSGTTGNPKGVLHEYGKLSYLMEGLPKELVSADDESFEKFAAIMPMSFVAFVLAVVCMLYNKDSFYVISFATARNFQKFGELLVKEGITETFMTPSMLRFYKNPAPTLKLIATGSEPAGGIFYEGGPGVLNLYSSTETGFFISQFMIDREYDKTPVGKNAFGMEIVLLDDDGKRAEKGATGEVCIENPYTRGYIHLPEQTAAAFRDGIYHTGDLGFLNENGELVLSGRADDMIKINGNRIEPSEIEAVAREILGVSNVVAKGFDEDGSAFTSLYCLRSEVGERLDGSGADELRKEMGKKLPSYMTPTYVMVLDEMPLNANGKVSRRLLPSPQKQELERKIEAPEGEMETLLCEAMAKALGLTAVGPNEDFYYLGGDSMKTIQLVTALSEAGVDISAESVYEGRTARALASSYKEDSMTEEERDQAEALARKKTFPLLHGQMQLITYGNYDPNRKYTDLGICLKLNPDADPQRLKKAADRVILAHPPLRTRILQDEAGNYLQCYDESCVSPTQEISAKEAEVPELTLHLSEQYADLKSPLYVSALIKTEGGFYYALVISHVIIDGGSQKLLLNQIFRAYKDETYVPEKDYYFSILEERLKKLEEKEDRITAYYQDFFGGKPLSGLKPDVETRDRTKEDIYLPGFLDRKKEYDNAALLAACALAEAEYNGESLGIVQGVYHGRSGARQMQSTGYLLQEFFLRVEVDPGRSPRQILDDVKEQMRTGVILDPSSYLMKKKADLSPMVRLIFQNDFKWGGELNELAVKAEMIPTEDISNGVIGIQVMEKADTGKLDLGVRYAKTVYKKESIERFLKLMLEKLREITGWS